MKKNEIFRQVPDSVHDAVLTALASLDQAKPENTVAPAAPLYRKRAKNRTAKRISRLSRMAAAFGVCFLAAGATAAAAQGIRLYRQRMEEMNRQQLENYYEIAQNGEATDSNRPFTAEEQARYDVLQKQYEASELFPRSSLTCLEDGASYKGDGVALDPSTRTLYFPDEALTDEELLEVIDFHHRIAYSIYAKNQEIIRSGDDWESRMAQLDDAKVDEIYLNMFDNPMPTSGERSRQFTESEEARYEALENQYENDGIYPVVEVAIIHSPEEYSGNGVALCTCNSTYYLPDTELSDEELLQLIDYEHKASYCIGRIYQEVTLGLRSGWPGADD